MIVYKRVSWTYLYSTFIFFFIGLLFNSFAVSAMLGSLVAKNIIYLMVVLLLIFEVIKKIGFLTYSKNIPSKFLSIPFLLFLSIFLYAIVSGFFIDLNMELYFDKLLSFLFISLLFFYIANTKRYNFRAFEVTSYIICIFYSVFILHNFDYIRNHSQNYLTAALPIGAAYVMAFSRILDGEINRSSRVLYLVLSLLFMYALVHFLSRGSFLMSLALSLFVLLVKFCNRKSMFYAIIITILLSIFIYVAYDSFMETGLAKRIMMIREKGIGDRSYIYQTYLNELSLDRIFSGMGFSQSGTVIYGIEKHYPHNIHLHYLAEFGVLGFLYSLVYPFLFIAAIAKVMFAKYKHEAIVCLVLFMYIYGNFMKSFSLFDSWWLAISAGFLWNKIYHEDENVYYRESNDFPSSAGESHAN